MATIRRRKNKYQVQVRRKDSPQVSKTFICYKDAKKWARETEIKLDQNFIQFTEDPCSLTLQSLIKKYIKEVIVHKKSYKIETIILKSFLQRFADTDKPINKIKVEMFSRYRDLRLQHVKPATVVRELSLIQHVFNTAIKEWELNIKNPINFIRKPKVLNRRERRLTDRECQLLVHGNYTHPLLRSIVLLAIETAMRRGEILNIKREHIKDCTLYIPKTKTDHPRTIPLTTKAHTILKQSLLPFPITANGLRLAWQRLKKKCHITDLHFHDLRHEAISRFFEQGLTVAEVALISGHRDYKQLFRYTHLKAEHIVQKINDYEKK